MAKRVSSIYGNALFELAVEEKKVDALLSEVQTLQQILLENADLLSLLNHPEVSKIEKLDLLKNIFSGRASDEGQFFSLRKTHRRLSEMYYTFRPRGNHNTFQ